MSKVRSYWSIDDDDTSPDNSDILDIIEKRRLRHRTSGTEGEDTLETGLTQFEIERGEAGQIGKKTPKKVEWACQLQANFLEKLRHGVPFYILPQGLSFDKYCSN